MQHVYTNVTLNMLLVDYNSQNIASRAVHMLFFDQIVAFCYITVFFYVCSFSGIFDENYLYDCKNETHTKRIHFAKVLFISFVEIYLVASLDFLILLKKRVFFPMNIVWQQKSTF